MDKSSFNTIRQEQSLDWMCLFLLHLSLHALLCLFCACVITRVLVWISSKCMVSCRVVIIPAHQVLSPCVANLPSLSLERPRVEGMTQRFRTNETRLQDLQQTVILSPSEERLLNFSLGNLSMLRSQDEYDDVVVSRGGDDIGHDVWLP